MEKSFDMLVEETRESVVKVLNESGLPLSVMDLLVKEVAVVIANQLQSELKKQREPLSN